MQFLSRKSQKKGTMPRQIGPGIGDSLGSSNGQNGPGLPGLSAGTEEEGESTSSAESDNEATYTNDQNDGFDNEAPSQNSLNRNATPSASLSTQPLPLPHSQTSQTMQFHTAPSLHPTASTHASLFPHYYSYCFSPTLLLLTNQQSSL